VKEEAEVKLWNSIAFPKIKQFLECVAKCGRNRQKRKWFRV